MLAPDAVDQLRTWLEESQHEVVVECVRTPAGVGWGRMLSKAGAGCSPAQVTTAPWCMHTHPRACYARNGTYYGWPSGADYATFLDQKGTEHLVCALEGIYVIRSTADTRRRWTRLSEDEKDALERQWDVPSDHPERTPERVLASLASRLEGWVDVTLYPYSKSKKL